MVKIEIKDDNPFGTNLLYRDTVVFLSPENLAKIVRIFHGLTGDAVTTKEEE